MKKTQEIIGLPVISIDEGNEISTVKNVIVNAKKGAIDFLVVDSGAQMLKTQVIPTDNILGIGEHAVTIASPEAIKDISKDVSAIEHFEKSITVKETKVLTRKGSLIGETGDFYVDQEAGCKIVGLEFIEDQKSSVKILPRNSVITFGKNLIVVDDNAMDVLIDNTKDIINNSSNDDDNDSGTGSTPDLTILPDPEEIISKQPVKVEETKQKIEEVEQEIEESTVEEVAAEAEPFRNESDTEPETTEVSSQSDSKSTAADLFEERQRQYLNGRKATKTIVDNAGNTIINAGTTITDEIIDKAKASGKLVELVMNNEM